MTLEERFWSKVDIRSPDECWEWKGSENQKSEYKRIRFGGTLSTVYRHAWILKHGSIPHGMCICHKCDNPKCCNTNHLFLGTQKDNMQDAASKGRIKPPDNYGEKNPSSKLTWNVVRKIRQEYTTKSKTIYRLAKEHGVNKKTMSEVVRNTSWHDENYTPISTDWGRIMRNGI